MILKTASRAIGLLAGTVLLSGGLSAASIAGIFNLTGNVMVTTTADTFGNAVIGDNIAITQLQLTGSFADLVPGQQATIQNLVAPPAGPVTPGTAFSLPNFVALPDGINLDAMSIPLSGAPVCGGGVTNNCVAYAGSPIVLSEQQGGGGTVASFSIFGQAHHAGMTDYSPFTGVLSAQFPGQTPADVIAGFSSTGSIINSYSAAFVVKAAPSIPEPASVALLGAGLLGLGFLGRKKLVK